MAESIERRAPTAKRIIITGIGGALFFGGKFLLEGISDAFPVGPAKELLKAGAVICEVAGGSGLALSWGWVIEERSRVSIAATIRRQAVRVANRGRRT